MHNSLTQTGLVKLLYDPRSDERKFCNCIKKLEKFRTSMGFEPVSSRYRCNQLSYEATDIGSWSLVGSSVSVRNESTMK